MKNLILFERLSVVTSGLCLMASLCAQEMNFSLPTTPVGYVKTTLLAASDTFIGTTLTRPPAYVGTVSSATAATLSVSGAPQWEAGEFTYEAGVQPNTYYARLGVAPDGRSNPFEGRIFKIEGGLGDVVTVSDSLNVDLSVVPAGTKIEIIPYWTLGTLFPPEDAGVSFEASTSPLITKTQLITPNTESTGINLPGSATYFFYNQKWRKVGQNTSIDYGDAILDPQRPLTVRNNNASAVDRDFFLLGDVALGKSSVIIRSQGSERQDNVLTIGVPVPTKLGDLNLIEGGAFRVATSPFLSNNELYVYSNETRIINKSSDTIYFYYNGAWRRFGQNIAAGCDAVEIPPDVKIIIRKAPSDEGTQFWTSETLAD